MSGHDSGPVLEEQPSSLIYPEGLTEGKVILSCQARANPAASYRCLTKVTPQEVTTFVSSSNFIQEPKKSQNREKNIAGKAAETLHSMSRPLTRVKAFL